jgi:hypothetical protein
MKTKFAIGCLVQWYECDIVDSYIETLKEAVEQYDGDVIVDINIVIDETLEKCVSREQHDKCIQKISSIIGTPVPKNWNVNVIGYLQTIADYRREFNDSYCDNVDVLIWGESDMLVPKQMFLVLDMLHQNVNTPKYIATFGICKMWDDSWKILEHPAFTVKQHSDNPNDWWSVNYSMNKDEMNSFNDVLEPLEVKQITPHKFNGCGLVISSEVIRSGVNIPKSVFFVHEDTAFMLMIRKVLGDIPQYHIGNILVVHNRKHKDKRNYILGETGQSIGQKRDSNNWYRIANELSKQNCYNNFNTEFKPYTWNDVWQNIK